MPEGTRWAVGSAASASVVVSYFVPTGVTAEGEAGALLEAPAPLRNPGGTPDLTLTKAKPLRVRRWNRHVPPERHQHRDYQRMRIARAGRQAQSTSRRSLIVPLPKR